jgi:hypothetical protein
MLRQKCKRIIRDEVTSAKVHRQYSQVMKLEEPFGKCCDASTADFHTISEVQVETLYLVRQRFCYRSNTSVTNLVTADTAQVDIQKMLSEAFRKSRNASVANVVALIELQIEEPQTCWQG